MSDAFSAFFDEIQNSKDFHVCEFVGFEISSENEDDVINSVSSSHGDTAYVAVYEGMMHHDGNDNAY